MKKTLNLLVFLLLSMAALAQSRLTLGGCLVYSDAEEYVTGLYSIQSDGKLSPLTLEPEAWATGGGVMKDGTYYCTCLEEIWEGFFYITGFAFDGQTWEQLDAYDLGTDLSFVATDMTYDATTGNIYGCFYDGTLKGYEFGTMKYDNNMSIRETIAPLAVGYRAIAAAADGTLYAVDFNGNLLNVDKTTGEGTVIGSTGLVSKSPVSAAINPETGEMFMTMLDDEGGKLYKIDTATAAKTLVCTFQNGEEITGLFFFDASLMDVPAQASDLAATFIDNTLTGTFSFKAPATTIGNAELTGELAYTVTANGKTVATGTTAPGTLVNAEVTLPKAGMYEFTVSLSNSAGQSRTTSIEKYVGDDIPAAVKGVTLTYADGQMKLTWLTPVGMNCGYIDLSKTVYNITRLVGDEETLVAEGLTETSFSEPFPEPETMVSVKYAVTAVYLGQESQAAFSNGVLAGTSHGISLPYNEDFEADGIIDLFTVIDANNDGQTWKVATRDGNRSARIDCNEKMAMDDWLITAPLKMEGGKTYSISFKAACYGQYFPERLEVYVGEQPTIEAMNNGKLLMEETVLRNSEYETLGETFAPEADGTYYIAFHGMSDADMFYILLDDLAVAEGEFEKGPVVPTAVENINVEEIAEGRVRITWTEPETDVNGRPIDSPLTYKIIDASYRTVAEGVEGTEFVYDAVEPGEQDFVFYYIGATNAVGFGEFNTSNMVLVGTPYAYPYAESFDDGGMGSVLGVETPTGSNADWTLYDVETAGIPDADGTNGFIGMYGYAPGETSHLYTAKLSLKGAVKPTLSFYYNGLVPDNLNTMEVAVREVLPVGADLVSDRTQESEWTVLKDFVQEGATEYYEWIKMVIPLYDYKDKTIQIRWTPKRVNYEFGLIDAIKIGEPVSHDLVARGIAAPTRANANTEFNVTVTVANDGSESAKDYIVELLRNGEKVQEAEGKPLAMGIRTDIVFKETLGVTVDKATYSARVVYDIDENPDNNETKETVVAVKLPNLPRVNDLAATNTSAGIELTWTAPDLENQPLAAVTEDFESATPFAQTVDGWTFVDADGARIGGIQGVELPFTKAAWFVIDYTDPAFGKSFESYSGTKHLSTLFNYNEEQNDDWMISPELCGNAQTVSLWAKSYVADYGLEKMEILYSTTDKKTSSFVSVKTVDVPDEWTEVTFDLPEGAKYFAIRYISKNIYMLFIDDVTYIPANAKAQDLVITGYNIYRDGTLIDFTTHQSQIANHQWLDTTAAPGSHTYVVTVMYEKGESAPSNEAIIEAIDGIKDMVNHSSSLINHNRYNLAGQKVDRNYRGIIIRNGKKVVK